MKIVKWILIITGLLLLLLPLFYSLIWETNKTGEITNPQPAAEQAKEVAAEAAITKSSLTIGDTDRIWITVRNRTEKPIFALRIQQIYAPGFNVDFLCQNDGTKDNCQPLGQLTIRKIFPQQTVVFWGEMKAENPTEKSNGYLVVSWIGGKSERSSIVVPVGGIMIATVREHQLHAARELMKDFALPLLLVLLGIYVGQLDKERETARQQHEQETQQEHSTWNSMLPETYKLAIRYYMKIQAAAGGFVKYLKEADAASTKAPNEAATEVLLRRAFFYMLLFERRMKYLVDHNSGFYFKSRAGEQLASGSYTRYRASQLGEDEEQRRNFGRMLKHIAVNESLDAFLNKLDDQIHPLTEATTVIQEGWKHFRPWVTGHKCGPSILLLQTFGLVLGWELNRPYAYWYGWNESKRYWEETASGLTGLADSLSQDKGTEAISQKITAYVVEGNKEISGHDAPT